MRIIAQEIQRQLPVGKESKRIFHGRGHCFIGYEDLLIDWFEPVILVSLYAPRDDAWLQQLVAMLRAEVPAASSVILQERYLSDGPTRILSGEEQPQIDAVEAGLRYRLRLGAAQNIGFFPDMSQGRALVRSIASGKRVLNLFSYTCSFSVAALAGGAAQVANLDMNRGALELGRLNHSLNDLDLRCVSFLALEFFRSVSRLKRLGPFDLIICDPPAYQGKSFKAERDWSKLLRKLPGLLAPDGEVIACLNGPHLPPNFLQQLFAEILPELTLVQKFQPGAQFPEAEAHRGVWTFHYQTGRQEHSD